VDGSGTIRVLKRDGGEELFDAQKLAGVMHRAMRVSGGRLYDARQLAAAIELYLERSEWDCLTSTAVFEMTVKVLRHCGFDAPADALEAHRAERQARRQRVRIRHEDGKVTLWDKSWLSEVAQRSWFLSPTTGRILAADVERDLLAAQVGVVHREDVVDMLNQRVAQYGLADAVPFRLPIMR
jgi:hypothetical protein